MSDVIPFPSRRDPFEETVHLDAIRVGLARAPEQGIAQADLQAVMDYDRPIATCLLQMLGAEEDVVQRCGALGLSRLISTMKTETDEPQPAAQGEHP